VNWFLNSKRHRHLSEGKQTTSGQKFTRKDSTYPAAHGQKETAFARFNQTFD